MSAEINPLTETPYPPLDHYMNEDGVVDLQKALEEKPADMLDISLLYWVKWPLPDDPEFNLQVKTEILKRTGFTLPELSFWEELRFKDSKDFQLERKQQGDKALQVGIAYMKHRGN